MSMLSTLEFAPMLIKDVFDSMQSSSAWYDKSKLSLIGEAQFPFISRTRSSNGVDIFCPLQDKDPEPGNALTIGLDTQTIAYQPVAFYTGQNIQVLRHGAMSEMNGIALTALIAQQMGKFSWGGNGATLGRLRKTRIMIPVLVDGTGESVVDWEGLTRLGEELSEVVAARVNSARQTDVEDGDSLPDLKFEPMLMDDLFIQHRGKGGVRHDEGTTPYIVAASKNNSHVGFVREEALFPGNWLAIVNTGAGGVGYCTYQPVPFWASNNVTALEPRYKDANEDSLLFLTTCVRFQTFGKFTYGNIANMKRLRHQRILVPVSTDVNGDTVVDWEGMATYGRALRVHAENTFMDVLEGTA